VPLPAWQTHLESTVLGNSLESWAYAALTASATLLLLPALKQLTLRRLSANPNRSAHWRLLITLIQRTGFSLFLAIALYLSSQNLALTSKAQHGIDIAIIVGVWFQVGLWASAVIVHVLREQLERRGANASAFAGGFTVISFMAQAVVWFVAFALALANAGVNIVALIAGLGMGGAALALATRSMLSNLFANASITLDKLFFIGDSLVSGEFQGTVEHIGNRATHLRSVNGELILISNADLLKSRLRNMGRQEDRREVLTIRVSRSMPALKVRQAVAAVEHSIREHPLARLDRCHFSQITAEALQLEAVYSVGRSADLAEVRDNIDAEVQVAFDAREIQFEYPVQRTELAFV
jgi:small-conductance mechanosensitive channel